MGGVLLRHDALLFRRVRRSDSPIPSGRANQYLPSRLEPSSDQGSPQEAVVFKNALPISRASAIHISQGTRRSDTPRALVGLQFGDDHDDSERAEHRKRD